MLLINFEKVFQFFFKIYIKILTKVDFTIFFRSHVAQATFPQDHTGLSTTVILTYFTFFYKVIRRKEKN